MAAEERKKNIHRGRVGDRTLDLPQAFNHSIMQSGRSTTELHAQRMPSEIMMKYVDDFVAPDVGCQTELSNDSGLATDSVEDDVTVGTTYSHHGDCE